MPSNVVAAMLLVAAGLTLEPGEFPSAAE